MTNAFVTLSGVSKQYGALRAVAALDLELLQGERVALVGHNGAGKSTLIKLMLGVIRPTAGHVEVLGVDPAHRAFAGVRMAMGFLPENVVFPPSMTGAEVMSFYARLKRQPVSRNAALLERVGIAAAARRPVGTSSKGMRQRLGLAQALIGHPRVLLLDEPTTGLDPESRQNFYETVTEFGQKGTTVLLSSHVLAEIEHQVDRVVMLDQGRKVADGTLSDLRRLSGFPTRITIGLPPGVRLHPGLLAGMAECRDLDEHTVEIRCSEANKLDVLRRLLDASVPLADIELAPPSLDDIYGDILRRMAAE
jgi:Cu-processing system ATP-binding protein